MNYIQLEDDTLILQTRDGPKSINRDTFNFNKILKVLFSDDHDEDLLHKLLETPDAPNGIYKAYVKDSSLVIEHKLVIEGNVAHSITSVSGSPAMITESYTYLGSYVSKQELLEDWPEYVM